MSPVEQQGQIVCPECGQTFSRRSTFVDHHRRRHQETQTRYCNICTEHFATDAQRQRHLRGHAERTEFFAPVKTAFNGRCVVMQRVLKKVGDLEGAWKTVRDQARVLLEARLQSRASIRYSLALFVHLQQYDSNEIVVDEVVTCLRATNRWIYRADDVNSSLSESYRELDERMDQALAGGSGWNAVGVTAVNLELGCPQEEWSAACSGQKSGRYLKAVPGRKYLIDLNIPRKCHQCFLIAYVQAFLPNSGIDKSTRTRLTLERIAEVNTKGVKMPMKLSRLMYFEKQNVHMKMGVNVFMWAGGYGMLPLYRSKANPEFPRSNTLLLETPKGWHFVYISNFTNMCNALHPRRRFVCENCLAKFSRESALQKHRKLCLTTSFQIVSYPPKDYFSEFDAFEKKVRKPIIGFADFETKLVPVSSEENGLRFNCAICSSGEESGMEQCRHNTRHLHDQIPMSFYIIFVDMKTKQIVAESCGKRDEGLMELFYHELDGLVKKVSGKLQRYKKEIPAYEFFKEAEGRFCYLCKKEFQKGDIRVRDHCHYGGQLLGISHQKCNLNRRDWQQKIPVFLHNLANFDAHLLVSGLTQWKTDRDKMRLAGLPLNSERFRTVTVNRIQFVDSLHFLSASLADLVDDLSSDGAHTFPLLKQLKPGMTEQELSMIKRKGFFPYEWATSLELLQNTRLLPDRQCFYSKLKGSTITEAEYVHALNVYDLFDCRNMEDYMELYLKTDVLLLAEVFCAFCDVIYNRFELDPANYISLPQLSWDMCLKLTGSKLQISADPDVHLLPEVNIRGGLSFAGLRHAIVENDFEHIIYIDANNLYGGTMMQKLPCEEYRWLSDQEINCVDWSGLDCEDEYGYIVECDLSYPEELHDFHNNFPLAAETMTIRYEDLSSYSKRVLAELRGEKKAKAYKAEKLCATLKDKMNYVCHGLNLQFYLQKGLKLKAVHRVLKFRQKKIFSVYVEEMTKLRKASTSKFQIGMWKRAVNTIFGKTLANERKHQKVTFATTPRQTDRLLSSPAFESYRILEEDLGIFFMKKPFIIVKRPFLIGFSILELSKLFMAKLYYDVLGPKLNFPELLFTDTDSFCMNVKGMTRTQMINSITPFMDFSNYPKDSPYYDCSRKAELGYIKDESGGTPISEVVSLRSKCYHISHKDSPLVKSAVKGVNRAVKSKISKDSFLRCLTETVNHTVQTVSIVSKNQQLRTVQQTKTAFTSFDDKRLLLECGIHTRAHGHVKAEAACERCSLSV